MLDSLAEDHTLWTYVVPFRYGRSRRLLIKVPGCPDYSLSRTPFPPSLEELAVPGQRRRGGDQKGKRCGGDIAHCGGAERKRQTDRHATGPAPPARSKLVGRLAALVTVGARLAPKGKKDRRGNAK